jgi:hypothetical protein
MRKPVRAARMSRMLMQGQAAAVVKGAMAVMAEAVPAVCPICLMCSFRI